MPCTPLTCVSIGSATVSITVLGLAPGYLVVTETVGGTTYVGVSLWDLLNTTTGIILNNAGTAVFNWMDLT